MATQDCPGYGNATNDTLKMGCWAEHEDGSLILVQSTEGGRVVYMMFDISTTPITEYRDAMPGEAFKKTFSWGKTKEKWVWPPPALPLKKPREYYRCLTCGKFIKKKLFQIAKFCNQDHYSKYLVRQ